MKVKYKQEKLWDTMDYELKNEQKIIDFNQKLAASKIAITNIHRKMAELEEIIAKERMNLANEVLAMAKIYKNLGTKQEKYIALASVQAPPDKITTMENAYIEERKRLTDKKEEIQQIRNKIQEKQNKIADLNTELSQKVAERAKIRHS